MRLMGAILGLCLAASAASGATFSYVGTRLSPDLLGGTGGKKVTFTFSALKAPTAGHCVKALKLVKYADGARTSSSLRAAGFQIIHQGDTGAVTFANVCLGADGTTVSGVYEILFERSVYPFTENYSITNATGNGVDLLEYLVYSRSVPSIYSDVSATPGVWTITP